MTKQEKFLSALGNVRDEYIEESDLTSATMASRFRKRRILVIGIAAALCCSLALSAAALMLNRDDGDRRVWETKYVNQKMEAAVFYPDGTSGEYGYIKKWEEKNTIERYPVVQYKDVWYGASTTFYSFDGCAISADLLGEKLGEAVLTGQDIYTDSYHQTNGVLHRIEGIDPSCAIAVLLNGEKTAYAYIDHYYRPSTLGDLVDGLSLEENLTFGSGFYYFKRNKEPVTVEFPEIPTEKIWELLADRDAVTVPDSEYESLNYRRMMSVSVSVPMLGIQCLSLGVTDNGYITTNLMGRGLAYFIGTEKTEAFMQYVLKNCKGYELIYIDDITDGKPEAGKDGDSTGIVTAVSSAVRQKDAVIPEISD